MSDVGLLMRQPKALLGAIVLGLLGCAFLIGGFSALEFLSNPPITVLSSKVMNPVIEQGSTLKLYVKLTSLSHRHCPGGVIREFSRSDGVNGLLEIYRDDAPAPIVIDERTEYVVNVGTVVNGVELPIGKYGFQGETWYYCGWFSRGRYRSPISEISIVPRGGSR